MFDKYVKEVVRKKKIGVGRLHKHQVTPGMMVLEWERDLAVVAFTPDFLQFVGQKVPRTLLTSFRFVRKLYQSDKFRNILMSSLVSSREKVAALLEKHYGPFNYCRYESAFDEYLQSMRNKYQVIVREEMILQYAGFASFAEIAKRGYSSMEQYVYDMLSYEDRERMIIESGGIPYLQWIEAEVDYFLEKPSGLISEYGLIFENLFPDIVQVDQDRFMKQFLVSPVSDIVAMLFGDKVELNKSSEQENLSSFSGVEKKFLEFFSLDEGE